MSPENEGRPDIGVDGLPAPLDLRNLVRSSWGLYRRRLRLWVGTCLLAYLVLHAVQALGIGLFLQGRLSEAGEGIVEFTLVMILVAIVGTLVTVLLIPAMGATVLGEPITFRESARRAGTRGRHAWIVAQYAILLSLLMLLPPFGFLLFVVGTEISLAMVAGPPIVMHAVVHEGITARDAWRRTRAIMAGQWLRIVMNILTIALGLGIVQFLVLQTSLVVANAAGLTGGVALRMVLLGAQTLFAAFALPFVFLGWFASYLDARARTEELTRAGLRAELETQGPDSQAGLTGP